MALLLVGLLWFSLACYMLREDGPTPPRGGVA